jgi:hypothetical protein
MNYAGADMAFDVDDFEDDFESSKMEGDEDDDEDENENEEGDNFDANELLDFSGYKNKRMQK